MGRSQTCRFFIKHSYKDIGRRKFHYYLAFLSVFIVVLSTLVIHSVVAKGPIIFMALGQEKVGSYDGVYSSRRNKYRQSINTESQTGEFLDYSQVESLFGKTYNLSPRYHSCGVDILKDTTGSKEGEACIMALDFEREAEIKLGEKFPYSSLAPGECLLHEK